MTLTENQHNQSLDLKDSAKSSKQKLATVSAHVYHTINTAGRFELTDVTPH